MVCGIGCRDASGPVAGVGRGRRRRWSAGRAEAGQDLQRGHSQHAMLRIRRVAAAISRSHGWTDGSSHPSVTSQLLGLYGVRHHPQSKPHNAAPRLATNSPSENFHDATSASGRRVVAPGNLRSGSPPCGDEDPCTGLVRTDPYGTRHRAMPWLWQSRSVDWSGARYTAVWPILSRDRIGQQQAGAADECEKRAGLHFGHHPLEKVRASD